MHHYHIIKACSDNLDDPNIEEELCNLQSGRKIS